MKAKQIKIPVSGISGCCRNDISKPELIPLATALDATYIGIERTTIAIYISIMLTKVGKQDHFFREEISSNVYFNKLGKP